MTRVPDFFIVGAPKCGTTAMQHHLVQHPDIYMAHAKELHYFGSDLAFRRSPTDRETYLAHFAGAEPGQRVGEASVMYLYSSVAAREIAALNPRARVLIMLRHPVDLMYSLHSQALYTCDETIASFAQALEAEPRRRAGDLPNPAKLPDYVYYRAVARLSEQVARYLEVFPRAQVHIVLLDEFKADSTRACQETLAFLDVDASFEPAPAVVNANKTVRRQWVHRLVQRPRGPARVAQRLLPRSWRQALRERVRTWNTSDAPRPAMEPGLRRRLLEEFTPEIHALSRVIDRDLSAWLRR